MNTIKTTRGGGGISKTPSLLISISLASLLSSFAIGQGINLGTDSYTSNSPLEAQTDGTFSNPNLFDSTSSGNASALYYDDTTSQANSHNIDFFLRGEYYFQQQTSLINVYGLYLSSSSSPTINISGDTSSYNSSIFFNSSINASNNAYGIYANGTSSMGNSTLNNIALTFQGISGNQAKGISLTNWDFTLNNSRIEFNNINNQSGTQSALYGLYLDGGGLTLEDNSSINFSNSLYGIGISLSRSRLSILNSSNISFAQISTSEGLIQIDGGELALNSQSFVNFEQNSNGINAIKIFNNGSLFVTESKIGFNVFNGENGILIEGNLKLDQSNINFNSTIGISTGSTGYGLCINGNATLINSSRIYFDHFFGSNAIKMINGNFSIVDSEISFNEIENPNIELKQLLILDGTLSMTRSQIGFGWMGSWGYAPKEFSYLEINGGNLFLQDSLISLTPFSSTNEANGIVVNNGGIFLDNSRISDESIQRDFSIQTNNATSSLIQLNGGNLTLANNSLIQFHGLQRSGNVIAPIYGINFSNGTLSLEYSTISLGNINNSYGDVYGINTLNGITATNSNIIFGSLTSNNGNVYGINATQDLALDGISLSFGELRADNGNAIGIKVDTSSQSSANNLTSAIYLASGNLSLTNTSVILNNLSNNSNPTYGILVSSGDITLDSSTINLGSLSSSGGEIAGLKLDGGSLTLTNNSTINLGDIQHIGNPITLYGIQIVNGTLSLNDSTLALGDICNSSGDTYGLSSGTDLSLNNTHLIFGDIYSGNGNAIGINVDTRQNPQIQSVSTSIYLPSGNLSLNQTQISFVSKNGSILRGNGITLSGGTLSLTNNSLLRFGSLSGSGIEAYGGSLSLSSDSNITFDSVGVGISSYGDFSLDGITLSFSSAHRGISTNSGTLSLENGSSITFNSIDERGINIEGGNLQLNQSHILLKNLETYNYMDLVAIQISNGQLSLTNNSSIRIDNITNTNSWRNVYGIQIGGSGEFVAQNSTLIFGSIYNPQGDTYGINSERSLTFEGMNITFDGEISGNNRAIGIGVGSSNQGNAQSGLQISDSLSLNQSIITFKTLSAAHSYSSSAIQVLGGNLSLTDQSSIVFENISNPNTDTYNSTKAIRIDGGILSLNQSDIQFKALDGSISGIDTSGTLSLTNSQITFRENTNDGITIQTNGNLSLSNQSSIIFNSIQLSNSLLSSSGNTSLNHSKIIFDSVSTNNDAYSSALIGVSKNITLDNQSIIQINSFSSAISFTTGISSDINSSTALSLDHNSKIQIGKINGQNICGLSLSKTSISLSNSSSIIFDALIGDSIVYGIYGTQSSNPSSLIFNIDPTSQILLSDIQATRQDAIGMQAPIKSLQLFGGGNITFSNITSPLSAIGLYISASQNSNFTFDENSKIIFSNISGGLSEGIYLGNGSFISFEGNGTLEFGKISGNKIAYGIYSETTNRFNFFSFDSQAQVIFNNISGNISSYGIYNSGDTAYDFGNNGAIFKDLNGSKVVGIYNDKGLMEISGKITFENMTSSTSSIYGIQNNGDIILTDGSSVVFGTPTVKNSINYKIYEGLGSTLELGNMTLISSRDNVVGIKAKDTTTLLLQSNKTLNLNLKSNTKEGVAFDGGNLVLSSQSQVIFNSNGGSLTSLSGNDGKILLSGTSINNRIQSNTSLLLRSLSVDNLNIANSSFVLYADKSANIDTINGYDGRAYNFNKTHTSQGGSDRIIINGTTLHTSTNNTLQIALSNFSETKTYVILAEVDNNVKNTVIFNGLTKSGDKAKITSYAGFETQTLEIERYDGVDKTYYFSHLSTPDNNNTGDSGNGNTGGGTGNGSTGGNDNVNGGDSGNNNNSGNGNTGGNDNTDGENSSISITSDYSRSTIESIYSNFSLLSANLNSLNKRMGDLRNNHFNNGIWARTFYGSLNLDFGMDTSNKNTYWTLQAGYDYGFSIKNATNFLGIALSYTNSNTTQGLHSIQYSQNVTNSITTSGIEFAIYNAYIADSGLYSDTIIKTSYLSSKINFFNQGNTYKLDNYAITLSQEVGYRFSFGSSKEWVITPQIEMAYSFLDSTDYTQILQSGQRMQVHQDAISLLRNRIGADWRYDFSHLSQDIQASLYVGTYYTYDVISGGETNLTSTNDHKTYQILKSEGRMVLNIGTDITLYEHANLYFDFEKSFLGKQIQTNYQINFGVRYSFGEKLHTSNSLQEHMTQEQSDKAPLKIEEKDKNIQKQDTAEQNTNAETTKKED